MQIFSLSRNEGNVGDEVIILGHGLRGKVFFNGVEADCEEIDGGLRTHIPAGAVTGPITVAGSGATCETQFTVNTVPHGKERDFQGIETGHQKVVRDDVPSNEPALPTANPEATSNKIPGVKVTGKVGGADSVDHDERKLEEETRVVRPPLDGLKPVTEPTKAGQVARDVKVTGPSDPNSKAHNSSTPTEPAKPVGEVKANVKVTGPTGPQSGPKPGNPVVPTKPTDK